MLKPTFLTINTLSDGWNDRDTIMLHACFQLLIDCVEQEKLLTGHIDWNHDEEVREAKRELETLYNWWKDRNKANEEGILNELETNQYEQDDLMLARLIKVRRRLWT